MKKIALCLVEKESKIDATVKELKKAGFTEKEISVLHPKDVVPHGKDAAHKNHTSFTQAGAVSGASVGAITGTALGLLTGLGIMSIPGIGPFLAGGPVMTALSAMLSGTAVGSGVGLIGGALVGMGIEEPEADKYAKHLTAGQTLIAVETNNEEMISKAVQIYKNAGAIEIYPRS